VVLPWRSSVSILFLLYNRYCGAPQPVDKSATHRSTGRWTRPSDTCRMRPRSRYLHRRRPDNANSGHSDMLEVLCCPSTTKKHTSISVQWRVAVACRGAGVLQAWLRLNDSCWSAEAAHGQASVCAERPCGLHGWFTELVDMTTCSLCCGVYTGFEFLDGFRSGWQC